MLCSVFWKTLYDQRWGIFAWGCGFGILALATAVGWAKAYPDAASRTALAEQLRGGLSTAEVLYGEPHHLDQLGGFVEWRALGLAPVIFGLFAIISATGVTRGAEERGTIEVVMASPGTRSRVTLEQVAALLASIVLACLATALILLPAGALAGEDNLGALHVAGAAANLASSAALFGAAGLLAAQLLPRRRTAALGATIFMFASHFTNTLPLVVPSLNAVRYVSPLYLSSHSSPLSTGHVEWLALAGVAAEATAVGAVAFVLSQRRDIFGTFRIGAGSSRPGASDAPRLPAAPSKRAVLLSNTVGRGVRDALGTTLAWASGTVLLAILFTALVPNVREALVEQSSSALVQRLTRAGLLSEAGILSVLLFSVLSPLVTLFGVTLGAGWARDELSQRLELELACPVPRWQVYLERLIAAAVSTTFVLAATTVAVLVTAQARGVDVSFSRIFDATWTLALLVFIVLALGFAVSSWRPGLAAGVGGAFVALSYFASLLIPLLQLPGWLLNVSVFGLYGQPLVDGVDYAKVAAMAGLVAVLVPFGAFRFQAKDIAR